MKFNQRHHALALAMALSLQAPAHAILNGGIVPSMDAGAPPIVNPFTGQPTEAWKLVGYLGCSAFQISREWVVQAGHCALGADGTGTYRGHLGTSTVQGTDCTTFGNEYWGDDFQLCRLKNPESLIQLSTYPAMVALPEAWRKDSLNATKYGSLMGYGHADAGDGLAFVGLDGYPYNFDAAAPIPVPWTSGGDSGGAMYWFPAGSAKAYMVGVLVKGAHLSWSPFYFRQDNLAAIKSIIQARGDTPPEMPLLSSVFTPPSDNPAPRLGTPPTLTRSGNTNTVTLRWNTPSASPSVSMFKVSLGRGGVLENSFSASANPSTNQVTLNLSAADKHTFCARPYNAIGSSLPTDSAFPPNSSALATLTSVNCLKIDNRNNLSTITGLATTGNTAISSQVSVGFAWGSVVSPSDMTLSGYRVTQAVSYATGPSRTTTVTVTAPRLSTVAPKGSKVCVTVAAVSSSYKLGPTSQQVCTMAN